MPKPKGKPRFKYSPELAEKVLELHGSGLGLDEIEAMPGMPSRRDINRWTRESKEFAADYEATRMLLSHAAVDGAYDVARKAIAGEMMAQDARNIADVLFRVAEKLNPKRYAPKHERSELNVTSNHLHLGLLDTAEWISKLLGGRAQLPPPKPVQD
jgi:hypothetical protein